MRPDRLVRLSIAALLVAATLACGAALPTPTERDRIQAAIAAARPGAEIKIGEATLVGNLRIDKDLTLSGAGRDKTTLRATKGNVLDVVGRVTLEHMTIEGKLACVYARKGAAITVRHCRIVGGADGLNFQPHFNTTAVVHHNEFVRCGDAIDLESTQAIIYDNTFRDCRDDAIDFDGDAGGIVFRNTITNCRDDGIEIRLARTTNAVIVGNTFDGCGEDGIELIDSHASGETHNLVLVAANRFRNCARYGVGGVAQKSEKVAEAMVQAGLFGSGNAFAKCGKGDVSPNLGPVDLRTQRSAEKVIVQITRAGKTAETVLPMQTLVPLAILDLQHDPNRKRVSDAEGIEIDLANARALVADDNARAIWTLSLRTAQLTGSLPTHPFPGSDVRITGPEGLAADPARKQTWWLACDDDKQLVVFSSAKDSFGKLAHARPIADVHSYPEGIAHAGDLVYLVGTSKLAAAKRATFAPCPGFPVSYAFEGHGSHVAGIAFDGKRLLMTASAYGGKTQFNTGGLLFAADPSNGEVRAVWSLGDYSSDPRGVAVAGGLVFVADGYGTPMLPGGTVPNRQGLKVFVFAPGEIEDLGKYLHLLPLRQRAAR